MRFAVAGDPVCHQKPVGFDFILDVSQAGVLFFPKLDAVFFEHSLQTAVGSAGFGGFGLLDYFTNVFLFTERV